MFLDQTFKSNGVRCKVLHMFSVFFILFFFFYLPTATRKWRHSGNTPRQGRKNAVPEVCFANHLPSTVTVSNCSGRDILKELWFYKCHNSWEIKTLYTLGFDLKSFPKIRYKHRNVDHHLQSVMSWVCRGHNMLIFFFWKYCATCCFLALCVCSLGFARFCVYLFFKNNYYV